MLLCALDPLGLVELKPMEGIGRENDLAARTKELLAEKADALILGDGMNADTQIGPLCNLPHWQGVCDNTAKAISEGATPLAGGGPADGAGPEGGYFFRPTILGWY